MGFGKCKRPWKDNIKKKTDVLKRTMTWSRFLFRNCITLSWPAFCHLASFIGNSQVVPGGLIDFYFVHTYNYGTRSKRGNGLRLVFTMLYRANPIHDPFNHYNLHIHQKNSSITNQSSIYHNAAYSQEPKKRTPWHKNFIHKNQWMIYCERGGDEPKQNKLHFFFYLGFLLLM